MPPGKVIIHRVHDWVDAFNARLLFLSAFQGLIMQVGAAIIYDAFSAERAAQGKFLPGCFKTFPATRHAAQRIYPGGVVGLQRCAGFCFSQ